jgi:ribonuclease T1
MAARGLAGLGAAADRAAGRRALPAARSFAAARPARERGRLIAAGGPYPYAQDNAIFGNYGGTLPSERPGYYREFTVKIPGASTRGTLRVVTGSGGEDYYTADHYASFEWIACARR